MLIVWSSPFEVGAEALGELRLKCRVKVRAQAIFSELKSFGEEWAAEQSAILLVIGK